MKSGVPSRIGIWNLGFPWSLEFGHWSFPNGVPCCFRNSFLKARCRAAPAGKGPENHGWRPKMRRASPFAARSCSVIADGARRGQPLFDPAMQRNLLGLHHLAISAGSLSLTSRNTPVSPSCFATMAGPNSLAASAPSSSGCSRARCGAKDAPHRVARLSLAKTLSRFLRVLPCICRRSSQTRRGAICRFAPPTTAGPAPSAITSQA